MFFLQMSGVPGAGKSTLARAISRATGAIVVDHDVVKSALLGSMVSMDKEIDSSAAGKISYDIEWALLDSFLAQGNSVILDSPCLYTMMVAKGMALAAKYHASYKYVECALSDIKEIDHRLKTRQRLISQNDHVASEEAFRKAFEGSQRPADVRYLVVDSGRPLESYFDEVIAYLNE